MMKISAREARKIAKRQGLNEHEEGIRFYAYDEKNDLLYGFETKNERDEYVETRASNK